MSQPSDSAPSLEATGANAAAAAASAEHRFVPSTNTTLSSTPPAHTGDPSPSAAVSVLSSSAPSAGSSSLLDEYESVEEEGEELEGGEELEEGQEANVALRKSKRRAPRFHRREPSSSGPPAPAILRGLSLKAAASSLSKHLSVSLQWTKEKLGRGEATVEEQPFIDAVDSVHQINATLKQLDRLLHALITAQQAAILAHDGLAATVKKIHSKLTEPQAAAASAPKAAEGAEGADASIAAIEAATSAFAESSIKSEGETEAAEKKAEPAPAGTQTAATAAGDDKQVQEDESSASSSLPPLSIAPVASNIVAAFYPYQRRLLAGRLTVSDSFASLLSHLRQYQSTTVKTALAAISQLETDRLHYDACQSNLRILTAPDSASTAASAGAASASTPSSALASEKHKLELEQWQAKVDAAQLVYLRGKQQVEDAVDEVWKAGKEVLERGLTAVVAVEAYEVEAGVALLRDEEEGKELPGRKRTNPAALGMRRGSRGRRASALEHGDDAQDDEAGALEKEVASLR